MIYESYNVFPILFFRTLKVSLFHTDWPLLYLIVDFCDGISG